MPTKQETADALLDRHGRTYAEELRLDVEKGTPSALFGLLCASALMSARISSDIATQAARNLAKAGWRTPQKRAESTWEQRVDRLNDAGYTRYQERTATMLGEMADRLLDEYGGDLRELRDAAERDPGQERKLLKRFKGIGDVGVDIFFREVQAGWDEVYPFADDRARKAAERLKLSRDPQRLAADRSRQEFTRLVAALVRTELGDDYDAVRRTAREMSG